MTSTPNARVLFNSIPKDYPVPGETTVYDASETIDPENVDLKGGFLFKLLVLSVDPYMRGRMREPDVESYAPPFHIGQPLDGYGIGIVTRSENSEVPKDRYVYGQVPYQQYTVFPKLNSEQMWILETHPDVPLTAYLGPAGMPGQTAFCGWKEFSQAQAGQVAFITTGAGAVGSVVVQLAKHDGLRVIASAGSDEKVEFLRSLGADVAFNYKTTDTREVLKQHGPIDVYWDNVGGETTDAALEHTKNDARLIVCGAITGYNGAPQPITKWDQIFARTLHIHGLLVFALLPKYVAQFYETVPPLIAQGKIKYREDVTKGLDKVGEVILAVQKGGNTGKAVVVVAEE
ncbi:unnamed protein product [Mycena citricolor]|uniref:Enoyl reductase (ER) domain-containing protein n=1 Tax=Mycena citricolor TaxID=2018698 RepID=A0AAD2K387_9AGAR|nr:unnamed protein product [Mycena citricolor]CAK5276490.1 unnamed protein product [Mycena citricolor]